MTEKPLILGFGTGRCGTASLAALLNAQPSAMVVHERTESLPWEPDRQKYERAMARVGQYPAPIVGDVASYWLNYLSWSLESPNVRAVYIYRDKDAVVESVLHRARRRGVNQYSRHLGPGERRTGFSVVFPTYDLPLKDGIARYWEEYQQRAFALVDLHPDRIAVLPLARFSDPEAQREMLQKLGFPEPRIKTALHLNQLKKRP